MLLVLSIAFYFYYNIWGCICSSGPFKYRWLKGYIYRSCYYHHQIESIHLSHCFHIFPWLCAWDVCYIIFCHLLYIHSGKTGNLFSWVLCSLWWVQIAGYVLACRWYSFVCTLHHLIIIIVQYNWTYKMPVRYNLSSVWVRLSIFSQLSIIQYVGLCVFSLPISFVMIERIYILILIIIIKSEVWIITHCLGLGHETMVCAVCLSIFLQSNIDYGLSIWGSSSDHVGARFRDIVVFFLHTSSKISRQMAHSVASIKWTPK